MTEMCDFIAHDQVVKHLFLLLRLRAAFVVVVACVSHWPWQAVDRSLQCCSAVVDTPKQGQIKRRTIALLECLERDQILNLWIMNMTQV